MARRNKEECLACLENGACPGHYDPETRYTDWKAQEACPRWHHEPYGHCRRYNADIAGSKALMKLFARDPGDWRTWPVPASPGANWTPGAHSNRDVEWDSTASQWCRAFYASLAKQGAYTAFAKACVKAKRRLEESTRYVRVYVTVRALERALSLARVECGAAHAKLTGGQLAEAERLVRAITEETTL